MDHHAYLKHSLRPRQTLRQWRDGLPQIRARRLVFSVLTSIESGMAFTPVVSINASLNADFTQRPRHRVWCVRPNDVAGGRSAARWYNPAAFFVPVCCQFGTASVGSLRGPNLINADWSLSKALALASFLNRESTHRSSRGLIQSVEQHKSCFAQRECGFVGCGSIKSL